MNKLSAKWLIKINNKCKNEYMYVFLKYGL